MWVPAPQLTEGCHIGDNGLTLSRAPSTETEDKLAKSDKRKQSLYFPEQMLNEIQHEANRQDRSLSWIVQKAWQLARSEIARYPSVNDLLPNEDVADDPRESPV